ncbi:GGDEF domain-containing protein [Actinoplanes sp. NPDC051494]|uniref:GGDEF domain-containing protein n=1 Tax=Actinoplanes sp. NPDC051494 TaxID=3363907 RepID=UPI0037930D67
MLLSGARELRDLHGASRAVAYLTLAGAPYVAVTGVLSHVGPSATAAILTIALIMVGIGLVCWHRPGKLPGLFWYAAPLIATALISGLNLGTRDASTGAQLFYLWPVLYTANFLGRKAVYVVLAMVYAGHSAVVYTVLGAGKGLADVVAMILAMTMTTLVVRGLRARADRLRDVLEQQANADPLTGLANRRSFETALAGAEGPLALITVDLDHFKGINDTYGHAEGDRALTVVAAAMRTVTTGTGTAARLGGDEFVLLLHTDRTTAVGVARQLTTLVRAATGLPGGPPSLSIGVAALPADADTVEGLVAASDAALYEAKTSGRGRIAVAGGRRDPDPVPVVADTQAVSGSAALTSPRISRRSRG